MDKNEKKIVLYSIPGLHKELFSAPIGEQPTCHVAKVRIGEENCSSVCACS